MARVDARRRAGRQGVAEATEEVCRDAVRPWPAIEKDPVAMSDEGRFVKAFPLEFPMGVADLKQPQLRDDYSVMEWVQHKLRYKGGHFVNSARGHRLIWAMFNTALLEASRQMGHAYHKATNSSVLTKRALQELVEKQADLVRECASFGAEIPTTAMFWKRMTTQLEWIVRQMSWWPAWIFGGPDAADPMRAIRAAIAAAVAANPETAAADALNLRCKPESGRTRRRLRSIRSEQRTMPTTTTTPRPHSTLTLTTPRGMHLQLDDDDDAADADQRGRGAMDSASPQAEASGDAASTR